MLFESFSKKMSDLRELYHNLEQNLQQTKDLTVKRVEEVGRGYLQQLRDEVEMGKQELDGTEVKAVIDYAIEKKLKSFKLNGFEFDLSGTDPKQEEILALRAEIKELRDLVNRLALNQSQVTSRRGVVFPVTESKKNG